MRPRRRNHASGIAYLFGGRHVEVDSFEGGALWHTDDMYSPHVVALFGNGVDEKNVPRLRLSSRRGLLAPPARHLPALLPGPGRHSGSLALRVTGFMSEDVYKKILGEHELELKRVQW